MCNSLQIIVKKILILNILLFLIIDSKGLVFSMSNEYNTMFTHSLEWQCLPGNGEFLSR